MKFDAFLGAMFAAIIAALIFPEVGLRDGPLHLGAFIDAGIMLVFFLHGAALSASALRAGVRNWRLHVLVQTTSYGIFPLLGLAIIALTSSFIPPEASTGIMYLCVVSSTISSSVAMTVLGHGNVPAAVFNATLSSLLGMALTPLLISAVTPDALGAMNVGSAIFDIFCVLILPFLAGQCARRWIAAWVARYKQGIAKLDRSVIVLIVYVAFCESTAERIWARYDAGVILVIALIMAGLLVSVLLITTLASRAMGFSRADEVAAVFCGSKKSLANGAPIAAILFGNSPALGMIMLPLIMYHQIQLIVCAILARRYARLADQEEARESALGAT